MSDIKPQGELSLMKRSLTIVNCPSNNSSVFSFEWKKPHVSRDKKLEEFYEEESTRENLNSLFLSSARESRLNPAIFIRQSFLYLRPARKAQIRDRNARERVSNFRIRDDAGTFSHVRISQRI